MSIWWKIGFMVKVIINYLLVSSKKPKANSKKSKPVHILFCTVDHYEPGINASAETEKERVDILLSEYPKLAGRHKDSAGNCPKRTWFLPPHYHRNGTLKKLVSLCEKGFGEIELHLHHGKIKPDTPQNLKKTIRKSLEEYALFGVFGSDIKNSKNGNGKNRKYAFVHGDWALNNSCGNQFCGVNNETEILTETGCYADFTFPSGIESNPSQINSIFYAENSNGKPKSHDNGIRVRRDEPGDNCKVLKLVDDSKLMIIQGPLHPIFKNESILSLRVFGDSLDGLPVTEKRIDSWVKTNIHVENQTDWVIIKTHVHGAAYDNKSVLGKEVDEMFTHLEKRYNDGENYILHYVTARELYNIIKAAEAGESGRDPEKYRNYQIKAPGYDSSPEIFEATDELKNLLASTYEE